MYSPTLDDTLPSSRAPLHIPMKPFWPRRFVELIDTPLGWYLNFAVWFLVGTALAFCSCGCSAPTIANGPAGPITRASVVTLVTPAIIEHDPTGADEDGNVGELRSVAFVPSCNAFAIRKDGNVYLVTAAHCTEGVKLGEPVRYLAPNGWGHGIAKLTWRDTGHDQALLSPGSGARDLVPLERGPLPELGARVTGVSAYYGASTSGVVVVKLAEGFYGTTQTVVRGWSGSPVLDEQGRVWGILSRCEAHQTNADPDSAECDPGRAIVASLP